MVLKRFFKPKWQHLDPDVRCQAVQALTSADTNILSRIAREDEASAVRRLALGRLDDLDSMHRASAEDNDGDIRQFARTRLLELLAGTRKKSPLLNVRVDFLSRHRDTELLEFVALNGIEPEFRKSAQDSITREAVLHDIAIRDALLANRLAALERITDLPLLEAIMQQARKRDKQIYRQSRERLDAIREAQARPARIMAESEQICAALDAMGQGGNWQAELQALQGLEGRWQAIKDEANKDRYRASAENEAMDKGELVIPSFVDNHEEHLKEHYDRMKDLSFDSMPENVIDMYKQHITFTKMMVLSTGMEEQVMLEQMAKLQKGLEEHQLLPAEVMNSIEQQLMAPQQMAQQMAQGEQQLQQGQQQMMQGEQQMAQTEQQMMAPQPPTGGSPNQGSGV